MGKKVKNQLEMLPQFEQNIYLGLKGIKVDEMKDSTIIKRSVTRCLGIRLPMELETGERVEVSVIDIITAETIKDAIKKPTTAKLKDLASIIGELKEKSDISINTPEKLFGDIVINDGSSK